MPHDSNAHDTNELLDCIKICAECSTLCARTAQHCLRLGGPHATAEHQAVLQDCKQACAAAVGFMARGSHYSNTYCRVCAEVCRECADDCDRIANGDPLMNQCAQTCRACAESCERMAGAGV
ncbi:hypothetical protein PHYC_03044 [Phycisphaerales bacterium]|nr:hypothetical protein PHYC_03044 [Phycisphaerales bacterium]